MTIALTEVRTPLRTGQQLRLSVLWFAMFAQWLTVLPVILPDQVGQILGAATANREGWIGTIAAAGAIVPLAVAPLVGAFSDRLQAVRGRRRPFLIVGVLGSCVSLLLLIPFDAGGETDTADWSSVGARNPSGRVGTPQDIAGLATFLCSRAGEFVVGQTIACDGGIVASS